MKCSVFFNLIYLLAFPLSFWALISFLCPQTFSCLLGYSMPYLLSFKKYSPYASWRDFEQQLPHTTDLLARRCVRYFFSYAILTRSWRHPLNLRIEKYACKKLTIVVLGYIPLIVRHLFWVTRRLYISDLCVQIQASQPPRVIGAMHVTYRWRCF